MKILALDTALNACSVAVMDGEKILASCHEARARGHAESLLPMMRQRMDESELTFEDLDAIAVSVGPGTFTGLRIGLAAARGIALAAGLPCIGITTLEALAASVPPDQAEGKSIMVAIDARRQEIYGQSFVAAPNLEPLQCAKAIPVQEAASMLPDTPFVLLGSGAALLKDAGILEKSDAQILDLKPDPDAKIIGKLALDRKLPAKNTPPPDPVYLRAPDAKLPGGKSPELKNS
ncbi:MAG: tRNA (adenosine(37)-N6)-threonylcarbamoyltransferase complex dimerization subunit type 1 TsaB [Sneathiella sp.]